MHFPFTHHLFVSMFYNVQPCFAAMNKNGSWHPVASADLLYCRAVVGNLFTMSVVIFVGGRTHNSSIGSHNIHPYIFFSSGGLAGHIRITHGAICSPQAVGCPSLAYRVG